jgi:uncharacterized protein YjiS (DUF1127 family)
MRASNRSAVGRMSVVVGWVAWQLEKRRSRIALLELTDDQLKDIGLSRGEAHGAATRRTMD